jgi:hypothetical protein
MVGGIFMFRKSIIYFILSLLVVLPVLGVFADQASAASSRVAVIKEMKGTVKVKKSGGSKEFTAFAKMSLNEGDILTTGGSSSAILQFANGTSEDDKMTVSSSTTLTFSKLSNSKGTSTKVSMFNGSAWVDVKSITSKNDEFSLETPTAIMGVRGTHLLVSVDPETGATHLTVAAGVVSASSKDSDGSKESKDIYPTQNALFSDNKQGAGSEITVAPVDLELLMKQSDTSIVQAILENAAAIIAENEHYVKLYEDNGVPNNLGNTQDDLARFKSNTENLLGAIADQAVKSGILSQERLDQIITEVQSQSGITVDLTKKSLQSTDEEQKQKEAQRLKDDEAKKQVDDRKKQEEADRKKMEETLNKLNDERKAKEEANNKAAEEKLKKAQEEYEQQLAAAEKQRFDDSKKQREAEQQLSASPSPSLSPTPSPTPSPVPTSSPTPSPSPTPSQTPTKSDDTSLSSVMVGGVSLTNVGNTYITEVPYETVSTTIAAVATKLTEGATAVVRKNTLVISPTDIVNLSVGKNVFTITVTAPNGTAKDYSLTVTRTVNSSLTGFAIEYKNPGGSWTLLSSIPINSTDTSVEWYFPYDISKINLIPSPVSGATIVSVSDTSYIDGKYGADLIVGSHTFKITTSDSNGTLMDFYLTLVREPLRELPSTLTSWTTTTTISSTPIVWQNVGFGSFSTYSPEQISSFTMSLDFNMDYGITSAKLFRINEQSDGQEIATWSGIGSSNTINGVTEGLNEYVLKFYSGTTLMGTHILRWVNGTENSEWTQLGTISLSDGTHAAFAPNQSGDLSYFAQVDSNIENLAVELFGVHTQLLYIKGETEPLTPTPSYGNYSLPLIAGFNHYEIKVKDYSGLFQKTYDLTILRDDGIPRPEVTQLSGINVLADGSISVPVNQTGPYKYTVLVDESINSATISYSMHPDAWQVEAEFMGQKFTGVTNSFNVEGLLSGWNDVTFRVFDKVGHFTETLISIWKGEGTPGSL